MANHHQLTGCPLQQDVCTVCAGVCLKKVLKSAAACVFYVAGLDMNDDLLSSAMLVMLVLLKTRTALKRQARGQSRLRRS